MIKTNNLSEGSPKLKQLQKFTFVGGTSESDRNSVGESKLFAFPNSMLLSAAQINDWVTISEIDTDRDTCVYLHQLGFQAKTTVKIISHTKNGSVIVSVDGNQIGLGSEITRKVVVMKSSSNFG